MFPLEFLPGPIAEILKALPFQYLAAFQAPFPRQIEGTDLAWGLLMEAGWALEMILIARLLSGGACAATARWRMSR